MRSQKQVRRVGKVRSLKNAVAGKRKTCRKRLEARKTWQHNTIMTKRRSPNNLSVLLPTTHKKIKEPKQRSAEELAERQRLREQKRLDKELAKQKASTSALPKIKKEKTEQTQPTVNLQQQAADARKTSEQKAKKQQKSEVKSQSNQKLLMEEKGNRMEVPEGYKKSKPPTPKMSEEKALVQSKTTMKEDDQNEMGRRMAEEMNKKQKKKRNRRSDAGYRLSDNDFIEGDAHEIDEGKANTDFTEIVGRNFKKKGHYVDQQSRYEESFFEDVVPVSRSGVEEFPSENCLHDKLTVPECYAQLQQGFSRKSSFGSGKHDVLLAHFAGLDGETKLFGTELFKVAGEGQRFEKEGNNLGNQCFQKRELERGEMQDAQSRQDIQNNWSDAGREHLIDGKSEHNNFLDQIESHREISEDDAIQHLTQELPERLSEFETRKRVDAEEHVYNDKLEPDKQQGALGESAHYEDRKHGAGFFPKEKAGILVARPFVGKGDLSEPFAVESVEHVERSLPKEVGMLFTELSVGRDALDEAIEGMEEFSPVEENGMLVTKPPTDHGSPVERINHVEESFLEEKIGVFVMKPADHGPCDGCVKHAVGSLKESAVADEYPADHGSLGECVEEQRVEESFAKKEPSIPLSKPPADHVASNGSVFGEDVEHVEESLAKEERDTHVTELPVDYVVTDEDIEEIVESFSKEEVGTFVTEPPAGHDLRGGDIEQDGEFLEQEGTDMIVTVLPADMLVTKLPANRSTSGESKEQFEESFQKEASTVISEASADQDSFRVSLPFKDVKHFEDSVDSDLRKDVPEPVGSLSPNENAQHFAEEIVNEHMPEGSNKQKVSASESAGEKGSVAEAETGTEIECGRLVQEKAGESMSTMQSEIDASLLTVVVADLQDGIDEQVKKEQEHVGRGGKDSVNEVLAPPTEDQNYFLVGPRFKTEGTVDHITLSNNEITKDDDETILKTEVSTEALSLSKELQMNMAKRAGEHPELLSTTIHDLNGAVNGKMTLKTYTKEAEREMNVEKREPIVLALERDNARRVQPVRERVYKLLPRDVQFCVRMIEKHGEDYEAMAEDEGNTFRDSAKGIARKIRIFKGSPQYEAYLKQKDDQKGPVS